MSDLITGRGAIQRKYATQIATDVVIQLINLKKGFPKNDKLRQPPIKGVTVKSKSSYINLPIRPNVRIPAGHANTN